MSTSSERLALNQAVYRELNERIAVLFDPPVGTIEFLCECSDVACVETVALDVADYEQVRALPTTFVVVPGHERPEIEVVVSRNGTHLVVDETEAREPIASMARGKVS